MLGATNDEMTCGRDVPKLNSIYMPLCLSPFYSPYTNYPEMILCAYLPVLHSNESHPTAFFGCEFIPRRHVVIFHSLWAVVTPFRRSRSDGHDLKKSPLVATWQLKSHHLRRLTTTIQTVGWEWDFWTINSRGKMDNNQKAGKILPNGHQLIRRKQKSSEVTTASWTFPPYPDICL